ncbi:unnamed protein product, partial [Trichogramma brassicae]
MEFDQPDQGLTSRQKMGREIFVLHFLQDDFAPQVAGDSGSISRGSNAQRRKVLLDNHPRTNYLQPPELRSLDRLHHTMIYIGVPFL